MSYLQPYQQYVTGAFNSLKQAGFTTPIMYSGYSQTPYVIDGMFTDETQIRNILGGDIQQVEPKVTVDASGVPHPTTRDTVMIPYPSGTNYYVSNFLNDGFGLTDLQLSRSPQHGKR